MITCSKMSLEELRKDFTSAPAQPYSASLKTVRVKAGNTRSWSRPVDELQSWPSLLAMFADDLSTIGDRDARATFMHHGRVVDGRAWSQILASAVNYPIELVLQEGKNDGESGLRSRLQTMTDLFKPRTTTSQPNSGSGTKKTIKGELDNDLRSIPALHVFQRDSNRSNKPLSRIADALHETLKTHSQKKALEAYDSCPEATLEDIHAALSPSVLSSAHENISKPHTVAGSKLERLAVMAEYVFVFFWPIDHDHIMTRRFCGALHALLNIGSVHGVVCF